MDGGGFHDDLTEAARIKHLKLLVMKKCPACQAQVEKHDGSLWYVCVCVHVCVCACVCVWVGGWGSEEEKNNSVSTRLSVIDVTLVGM